VFHDDIVDDDVLPFLSLEVDGLTAANEARKGQYELRPDQVPPPQSPDTTMPVAVLGSDQLDVYGWEVSWWKKVKGYFGF
jgi:hypothetical protein